MPGAYAHITLVNIMKETDRLKGISGFSDEAITAILDYFKFCELGAVSPDYPYLVVGDAGAAAWADTMHYLKTGEMIQAGVGRLKGMSGDAKRKGLSWLLGYSAHVATDVTIHPIVELKVGPYAENKKNHRICEMNQDAHIFQRLHLGEVGLSEHLDSGIGRCGMPADKKRLDQVIGQLWGGMLQDVYGETYASNVPDINKWHNCFMLMVDKIAEEGNHLMPLARHVAVNLGLTYPAAGEIDPQYIKGLKSPSGPMSYDEIFNHAVQSVTSMWQWIVTGVMADDGTYLAKIGDWNLDTGRNPGNQLVYWS